MGGVIPPNTYGGIVGRPSQRKEVNYEDLEKFVILAVDPSTGKLLRKKTLGVKDKRRKHKKRNTPQYHVDRPKKNPKKT